MGKVLDFPGVRPHNGGMSATTWEILGRYPQANGQVKITARSGDRVVHIERLSAEVAEAYGPDDVAAYWARCAR